VRQRNEACPSGFEYPEFRREYLEEPGASYLARGLNLPDLQDRPPLKNKLDFGRIKSYYDVELWCGEYAKKENGSRESIKNAVFPLIVTDRRQELVPAG
jgi:hypothetical protein